MRRLTKETPMPARPKCPDCHKQLRVKALTDSDHAIHSKWRYCEECSWDELAAEETPLHLRKPTS